MFVSCSGTLELFISDHQPIYLVHKKGRDARGSVGFTGRSYRHFDKQAFMDTLSDLNWAEFYNIADPGKAWLFIRSQLILNKMCPLRKFSIKSYRPDWMSNELIEQIKDRDYFYPKAKRTGDSDAWNIAKYLRNATNSNIGQAKRDFILDELRLNEKKKKKNGR